LSYPGRTIALDLLDENLVHKRHLFLWSADGEDSDPRGNLAEVVDAVGHNVAMRGVSAAIFNGLEEDVGTKRRVACYAIF
jgi:hypothetical protein